MATRLTKQMRAETARRIINQHRAPRDVILRNREHALAVKMLRRSYGTDVFDRCNALPEGWLTVQNRLSLEHQLAYALPHPIYQLGEGRFANSWRSCSHIELRDYTPLPCSAKNGWNREILGDRLYNELYDLWAARREFEEAVNQVKQEVESALSSFYTVEKLAEAWPAGYAHFPAELLRDSPAYPLPAPRLEDVNARLARLAEAA